MGLDERKIHQVIMSQLSTSRAIKNALDIPSASYMDIAKKCGGDFSNVRQVATVVKAMIADKILTEHYRDRHRRKTFILRCYLQDLCKPEDN